MRKTRIEWADYVFNPIEGLCPVNCWYCYARRMYRRFNMNPQLKLSEFSKWSPPAGKHKRIFVCSTMELFHPVISDRRREMIFHWIEIHPQQTFIILTKMPERIDRSMPKNVWLGVTITEFLDYWRKTWLRKCQAEIKFVSYEPILGPMPQEFVVGLDWMIMGRLTGYGQRYDPEKALIENIVEECRFLGIPVFLKDNLREIWGEPLIQEFPR